MEQPNAVTLDPVAKMPGASDGSTQLKPVTLTQPFRKIALAVSGGGFRAASFSIGTMSYLATIKNSTAPEDKGTLLDNVEFISSASDGTFAGMLFAARAKEGIPFDNIYHELLHFMEGQSLLENVLQIINDEAKWTGSDKNRNFINAFSKIYDKLLFKGTTFEVFWKDFNTTAQRNIEVCFNATEFYRGLSFRFQAGKYNSNPQAQPGKTGNAYIFFEQKDPEALRTLKAIKLGDILAASSCFPAGFEPVVLPEDFSYAADKKNSALLKDDLRRAITVTDYDGKEGVLETSFGLMDGGIDDNQGVYSAILADKRRRNNNPDNGFDLIMVTDVASYFMDPYEPPPPLSAQQISARTFGGMLNQFYTIYTGLSSALKRTSVIATIALIASVLMLAFGEAGKWTNIGFLLLSPSILLLLLVVFLIGLRAGNPLINKFAAWLGASDNELTARIRAALPATRNFSDSSVQLLIRYLKQSPVPVLDRLLKTRVNSMLSLVLDINLKQTRRLIFDIFYENFYGKNIWDNRRVFNVIYELSTFNKVSRANTLQKKFDTTAYRHNNDDWSKNCRKLLTDNCRMVNSVAENARTMGTTLWFDSADEGRMKAIVACGQFTACCKMLEYALVTARIIDIEKDLDDDKKTIRLDDAELKLFNQIKDTLEADWKKFTANPFYLYDMYETRKPS